MENKKYLIILIIIILFAGGVTFYAVRRKKKINGRVEELRKLVSSNVGLLGEDIDSVLVNVKEDTSYNPSKADLEKIKNAKTAWYQQDKPEDIMAVLKGKTKGQIKRIISRFASEYGIKLNDHLNEIFSDVTGYDTVGYQKILTIVKNAR